MYCICIYTLKSMYIRVCYGYEFTHDFTYSMWVFMCIYVRASVCVCVLSIDLQYTHTCACTCVHVYVHLCECVYECVAWVCVYCSLYNSSSGYMVSPSIIHNKGIIPVYTLWIIHTCIIGGLQEEEMNKPLRCINKVLCHCL